MLLVVEQVMNLFCVMETELWKDISNWDYQISNFGNVKSNITNKIIKPWQNKNGYVSVTLHKNGIKRNFYIHRLVAKYFVENKNPKSYFEINHIDENKKNNHYTNLEWCDRSYNCQYSDCSKAVAEYNRTAVYRINPDGTKTLYNSTTEAGKANGLSRYAISKCINGVNKTAGGYEWISVKPKIKLKCKFTVKL